MKNKHGVDVYKIKKGDVIEFIPKLASFSKINCSEKSVSFKEWEEKFLTKKK